MSAQQRRLRVVWAPQVVGIPPTNPVRELLVLPDGRIRHHGFRSDAADGTLRNIHLTSADHGFSWSEDDATTADPHGLLLELVEKCADPRG